MKTYMLSWGHIYLVHFGAWISFCFGASVYKNGIPKPRELCGLFKSAIILSAVLSIFSSHSHNHYLTHFKGIVNGKS